MTRAARLSPTLVHWTAFGLAVGAIAVVCGLYGWNIVRWQDYPDFGFRNMMSSGPNVVAEVFDHGEAAGLRAGDRIVAINGRPYSTFKEFLFGNLRDERPGSTNTYTVIRGGHTLDIGVTTGRLGLQPVLWRSGPLFLLGVVYVLIGALVFLMKPRAVESWIFFVMAAAIGLSAGFAAPAELARPVWLYDVRYLAQLLLPASMIHLAFTFPKPRAFLLKRPWLAVIPYLPAVLLFGALRLTSTGYWSLPRPLVRVFPTYAGLAIVIFLASTVWNTVRERSIIIRLQSRVILVGIVLGLLIPVSDLVLRAVWHVHLFSTPAIAFAVCLTLFPLSIGYTIVKHDLFAIDVIVRRTYGYVLSTGSVVGAYALIVSGLNFTFQGSDVARSPVFSVGFAIVVVLLFEPVHRRFQAVVDRVFYRQQYDYRKTIKSLSDAMTSILDEDVILKTLVGSIVREMFLENGILLLPRAPGSADYGVGVFEGAAATGPPSELRDDPLVRLAEQTGDAVLRSDVAMNPAYERDRPELLQSFGSLSAELVMPLKYKGAPRGIISLGRKKSGKLFTPEDLDLLRALTSQSAIALENARLFKENLQKGRMEEELKIAHDIQMSMLPDKAPQLEGLTVAARTIPAREVGGDFYDFVEFAADRGPGRLGIIIGDVSGKGVSAGLLMAGARSTYRVLLDSEPPVGQVMAVANQRLHKDIRKGMFVALAYAVLDPATRTLTLSNAGQTEPVLCPPNAEPSYITAEGDTFPLGIVTDCDYQETKLSLPEGTAVILYTDGVVEAMNAREELYGFDRFLASIKEGRGLEAPVLLNKLLDDVTRFVGGADQHDDITIIVARIT